MKTYRHPVYEAPPRRAEPERHWPVIVVGAGPVGLAATIDLAQRGIDVLLLDEDKTVSVGSRAICWSKRTLEIFDRLGCGQKLTDKGVSWSTGRVFHRDRQVFEFNLSPEMGHRRPAFINLQQYWVEQLLVERLHEFSCAELRWQSKVVGIAPRPDRVEVEVLAPGGSYTVTSDWLIAADGSRSTIRGMLGLESEGQEFRDRFLIADIHMSSEFPTERWFWFDPPFHQNQSALLHRQADDVWRVDFQLGWDADPDVEKRPENIVPRLRAMLGDDAQFEIEWASVYTFQCRRLRSFRNGHVVFAGDAAHVVSPFGARGANSGVQDVDNLGWKLGCVLRDGASDSLIDSYDAERRDAADENITHSTRSTDFITPKSAVSKVFRDAVLMLARRHAFARKLVNSGRLSTPSAHTDSPLNTVDADDPTFAGAMRPGAAAADGPVEGARGSWLLGYLADGFTLLSFGPRLPASAIDALRRAAIRCNVVRVIGAPATRGPTADASASDDRTIVDVDGLLTLRYDARPGTCYLFRPDQHVCARWRSFDLARVRAALHRATCSRADAMAEASS